MPIKKMAIGRGEIYCMVRNAEILFIEEADIHIFVGTVHIKQLILKESN